MNTTTDAGTEVRTRALDDSHEGSPVTRLVELRATVLGGRGPGASTEEVTEHTRDRSWLGAVPAPVERALVHRQTEQVRAGEPIVNHRVLAEERSRTVRAAALGAVAALAIRAVVVRGVRPRRHRRA
ncbi:hypothetical protein [Terrabacter sp. Root85]|uniref:hypothetical protein n=1 Tax=Terrabacter sp. Root85 TaxID=1736603 RepID=UPI000B20EFC6|nr:hypothetical protein [Terrabacter sp. Root85]